MELDERLCPFCAEVIKSAAVKCKHCGSLLTPSNSHPERMQQELKSRRKRVTSKSIDYTTRKLLESVHWTFCGYFGLLYGTSLRSNARIPLTDIYISDNYGFYLAVTLPLNLVLILMLSSLYVKDRNSLDINIRSKIPWYSNLFFVIFLPFLAIPLYFKFLKKMGIYSFNLAWIWTGWILAFLFAILMVAKASEDIEDFIRDITTKTVLPSSEVVSKGDSTNQMKEFAADRSKQMLDTYASYMCGDISAINSSEIVGAAIDAKKCVSECKKTGALYHFEIRGGDIVETVWSASERKTKRVLSGCKIADEKFWICREESTHAGIKHVTETESRDGHIINVQLSENVQLNENFIISFCFLKLK